MKKNNKITFQFISEPSDVNFGGKVHGGAVMKWIDQASYACARNWSESYCVTVYVGGIHFYKPININELIKIDAYVIYTGKTSIHIRVDVCSGGFDRSFVKKTHCVIVFVSVDAEGNKRSVEKWIPQTPEERKMEEYALKLIDLRRHIDEEIMLL